MFTAGHTNLQYREQFPRGLQTIEKRQEDEKEGNKT
jgi:hypothetical protein